MEMAWAHFKKRQDDKTNQSLKWNPQGNRKVGRPKFTRKRKLQNELKKEINKTLSANLNSCCFQRKMERPCAWPALYLEINGNDDEAKSNKTEIFLLLRDFLNQLLKLQNTSHRHTCIVSPYHKDDAHI